MPRNNQCTAFNEGNGKRCLSNICKLSSTYNGKLCYIHYSLIFGKAADYIKNIYETNKKRKAIKIYKALPRDLQMKILFHIHENDLIKKHHHDVIEGIIVNKYQQSHSQRVKMSVYNLVNEVDIDNNLYIKNYLNGLYNLLYLVTKYNQVISYEFHALLAKELEKVDQQILSDFLFRIYGQTYPVNSNYRLTLINMSSYLQNIFKNKYNDEYSKQINSLYDKEITYHSTYLGLKFND